MVRERVLKESLKVDYWQSLLVLDTAPGGNDVLLVRAIRLLVIVVVVAGHGCNPLRVLP
jgi:hypothetical protein